MGPPYYAVIFSSTRTAGDHDYAATARRMEELAESMPGFLGIESARGADGFGITVSYWRDEASIAAWRQHGEHVLTQERGKREWYVHYNIRIARVDRCYSGPRPLPS
jgi:heme-degrading monooxygenase HmoA